MQIQLLIALAVAGPLAAAPLTDTNTDIDAEALFLANCATCHGTTGDGQGATVLDRPARSFKDGGFSFGNTPEALFRTITTGIPGTPMPGFAGALSDPERMAVAAYVRTLGPPIEDDDVSAAVLVVEDRPLVVRGHLPALVGSSSAHPRGLLIGNLEGLTFQYRVDDVRLLAVRQGGFVRRADWTGRGGSALEPLGQVVHLVDGGEARPLFEAGPIKMGRLGEPFHAQLESTWVRGGQAGLTYRLSSAAGQSVAIVHETATTLTTSVGAGFVRHFTLEGSMEAQLAFRVHSMPEAPYLTFIGQLQNGACLIVTWSVAEVEGKGFECVGYCAPTASGLNADGSLKPDAKRLALSLNPETPLEVTVATLYVSEWNDDVLAALTQLEIR
jgi:mono/diheme cytochrome c family protein